MILVALALAAVVFLLIMVLSAAAENDPPPADSRTVVSAAMPFVRSGDAPSAVSLEFTQPVQANQTGDIRTAIAAREEARDPWTYVVGSSESLYRISVRFGVTMDAIMTANNLDSPRAIYEGQRLIIPQSAERVALSEPVDPAPEVPLQPAPDFERPSQPLRLNGVSLERIIVLPENVRANVRLIFEEGQRQGRNPAAFSKVGDSTIENPYFLARFDIGPLILGQFDYLQPAIDFYNGSFSRQGYAVRRGMHSWTANDPLWADKNVCFANETPVACEIRLHSPAILLIRLGANDAGVPALFESNLRSVVTLAMDSGVIPVIGTKADRFEGSNINNEIMRAIAAEFAIPLWDFDRAAAALDDRGLKPGDVHMTHFYSNDYTLPEALTSGHGLHNLTALMVLYELMVETNGTPVS